MLVHEVVKQVAVLGDDPRCGRSVIGRADHRRGVRCLREHRGDASHQIARRFHVGVEEQEHAATRMRGSSISREARSTSAIGCENGHALP